MLRGSIHGMTSTRMGHGLDLFREGDFPIYPLTFVRDLPPAELLTRMGVDPETLALRDAVDLSDDLGDDLFDDEEPVVTSGIDDAWTWAWEQGGVHGLDERILRHVSVGTGAVVLHHNEKPMHWFKYAVGGEIIIDFYTLQAIEPIGQNPARLEDIGASASVGSVADSYDNAMAEALNGTFKAELIEMQGPWKGPAQVERAIFQWITWYNEERLHSALDYVPPAEYERGFWQRQERVPQSA